MSGGSAGQPGAHGGEAAPLTPAPDKP